MSAPIRHGHCAAYAESPEYVAWKAMIARCERPGSISYRYYGGRGIRVCAKWKRSFEAFLEDVGLKPSPAHSIDRINNEGHYEPGNVRWATRREQRRNLRSNRWLTIRGVTQCLADWATEAGISRRCLYHRLKRGWPMDELLESPDPSKQHGVKRARRTAGERSAP